MWCTITHWLFRNLHRKTATRKTEVLYATDNNSVRKWNDETNHNANYVRSLELLRLLLLPVEFWLSTTNTTNSLKIEIKTFRLKCRNTGERNKELQKNLSLKCKNIETLESVNPQDLLQARTSMHWTLLSPWISAWNWC